ncbi:MAG: hypothetical protein ACO2PM_03755 [Pyrobaculum sp.]
MGRKKDIIEEIEFQPFLRFNLQGLDHLVAGRRDRAVSTLLEIQHGGDVETHIRDSLDKFQPFLRFNGSCVRLLWVFKFFFGFL